MSLPGQNSVQTDTIRIQEVIIKRRIADNLSSGFRASLIDSSLIKNYSGKTISELLEENSSVFIKNYGAGGIATPSFRGTGPGHTRIEWNDININSPMTGQSDLSLMPAGLIDRVEVYYGSNSMSRSSGGIGGTINMKTGPDWNKRFMLLVNPEAGSFERYSGLIKLNAGNSCFQSVSKVFLLTAENNFPFKNSVAENGPEDQIRRNNQVRQNGYMQELYYKLPEGVISAKVWYQSTFRNLPEPIITLPSNSGEKQRDESFRSVINYEADNSAGHIGITAAMVHDNLHYINRLASIDSRNNSNSFIIKGTLKTTLGSRTILDADLSDEISVINSNNYTGKKTRNMSSAGIVAETGLSQRIQTRVLVREILLDNKVLVPDFSAGAQFRIFPDRNWLISTSFSGNSRIPSLNDMYWNPGGNPDLKNEKGYIYEISVTTDHSISTGLDVKPSVTLFHNVIRDMIQWRPGDFSYWEADNAGTVKTYGLESSVSLTYLTGKLRIFTNAGYTLTKASSVNNYYTGKQIIYVPVNRINGTLRLYWPHFYSGFVTDFTGKRFLTADNSSYLPAYFVNNIDTGTKFKAGLVSYDFRFSIDNIFNARYQNIAWYPMPGRSFLVSIIVQFNK